MAKIELYSTQEDAENEHLYYTCFVESLEIDYDKKIVRFPSILRNDVKVYYFTSCNVYYLDNTNYTLCEFYGAVKA